MLSAFKPATNAGTDDAGLLHLLTQTRRADTPDAAAELGSILAQMAETPAAGLPGIAAKAARLCRSAADGGGVLMDAEAPLVASLAADLARLAPEVAA